MSDTVLIIGFPREDRKSLLCRLLLTPSLAGRVLFIEEEPMPFSKPPVEIIEELKEKMHYLSAVSKEPFETPEENRKCRHWQKYDRLPFYAGIRSRKQRR